MDGVFINLTPHDLHLENEKGEEIIIKGNSDLVTPSRQAITTDNTLNCIYHNENNQEGLLSLKIQMFSEHIKYPLTQDQIDKINSISRGRTRLFILDRNDIEYWSNGKFQCPFRNYRLFTLVQKKLIEYPIPKTYLDIVGDTVGSAFNASKKIYSKTGFS